MVVVQVEIERLSTKKIKQVEEVATFNQDYRHKSPRKACWLELGVYYMLQCVIGLERKGKKWDAWETSLGCHVDIVIQPQMWEK